MILLLHSILRLTPNCGNFFKRDSPVGSSYFDMETNLNLFKTTGGLASPPESQFNSPNVAASTMLGSLPGIFSPSHRDALDFRGDDLQSRIGYKHIPEKPPSPKCVDPKVFLNTTLCSWDGALARREDDQADQDSHSVDDGSGLPPRLRKLSLSSQSSLSESGGGDAGRPSEKRSSVGKRVKQKMIVDRTELTSGSPGSSGDGKNHPRGGEENCPSVDGENGDGDDPMVAVGGKNGDVDDPMVAVEGENGAGDDPMVTVEPVVAVEPRQLSSHFTDVDGAPSGDALSDAMSVDEDHPADGADPKKSFRVIDGDSLINVGKSKSKKKFLDSVLSVQPEPPLDVPSVELEPPLERRRSARIAMEKIDYHVQASKNSGGRRRRASKKDKDLPEVVLLTISLSKG
jgi:hypothetical protein